MVSTGTIELMSEAMPQTRLPDGRRLYVVVIPTWERADRAVLAYGSSRHQAMRAAEDQWGGVARSARLVR